MNDIETSVYRKSTNTNIYINWNSHAPSAWKIGTLRNLLKRARIICSTDDLLNSEVEHLRKVFCEINDFPTRLVNKIITEELNSQQIQEIAENNNEKDEKSIQIVLPYKGKQGQKFMSKMKKKLERSYLIMSRH